MSGGERVGGAMPEMSYEAVHRAHIFHLDTPGIFWLLVTVLGPPLIWMVGWRPLRVAINKWRLQKRREKYPHIVVLQENSAGKPAAAAMAPNKQSVFSSKNLVAAGQNSMMLLIEGFVSIASYALLQPSIFVALLLVTLLRDSIKGSVRYFHLIKSFLEAKWAAWNAPPKDPLPPSLLRKPKKQRLEEAENKDQPVAMAKNNVKFDQHSNDEVKTQQYYYNPFTEPGDRVSVEKSQTPPRHDRTSLVDGAEEEATVMEDPEEIGRRWSERSRIKQRIQTPPPKRRQKELPDGGKENSHNGSVGFVPGTDHGNGKKSLMLQQQQQPSAAAFSSPPSNGMVLKSPTAVMNANAGATPMRMPRPRQTLPNNNKSPQPIMHSSRKQPLSAQVRKRRMAGETMFSHSAQETNTSLQVSTEQGQPKRRRLISGAPSNTRKNHGMFPPMRRNNKREREEQILQEFNRKREKPAPVEQTSSKTAPVIGTPAGTSVAPIVFGNGLGGAASTGSGDAAATAATPAAGDQKAFVFGGATSNATSISATAAAHQPDGSAPVPAAAAAADSKPFVFGAVAAPATDPVATTPGATFAVNPVVAPPAAATEDTTASKPFIFGTPGADASTPSANSASVPPAGANPPGVQFGATSITPGAAAVSTPGMTFGANNNAATNSSTAATPAPSSGITFGANTPTAAAPVATGGVSFGGVSFGGGTPATAQTPTAGISFGNNTNAGSTPAPTGGVSFGGVSFGGGGTPAAAQTPTAGTDFGNNTHAGSTPAPTGGMSFGNNSNAGSTPAPTGGMSFGNNVNVGSAPAPTQAAGFSFGANTPTAKPDPPATNATVFGNGFGANASNTPQPTQGGSSFMSPPIPGMNSTAGSTPGFQAPPSVGGTPGFGTAPPAAGGFSGGFGNAGAALPTAGGFGVSAPGFQGPPAVSANPGFGAVPSAAGGFGGSSPGFQAPPSASTTPGFGAAPAAGGGFGGPTPGFQAPPVGGGFGGAAPAGGGFGGAAPAPQRMGGGFTAGAPPSGASARRRSRASSRKPRR